MTNKAYQHGKRRAMSSGASRRRTGVRFRTTILTAGKTAGAGVGAKTDETRQRRLDKTLAELRG
jgi:hypothetical protein